MAPMLPINNNSKNAFSSFGTKDNQQSLETNTMIFNTESKL